MQITREDALCIFGVMVSVLLRICTSLHPYSGQDKPPMYGDYEAQRHWMEITVNLNVTSWYRNSSSNDLQYWGLDYPPLTAYHSYLCGVIAKLLNPKYVELFESRGYESDSHKIFMRYTVLFADLFVYIPAVIFYFYVTKDLYDDDFNKKRKDKRISSRFAIVLALLYPGIILVDHGHFQYNCVSLGFAVLAIGFICASRNLFASVCFCLALNYKQMELYHAFPFFLYLLNTCIPKPGAGIFSGCWKLFKIGCVVVLTFGVIWWPFLSDLDDVLQVVHRLFPVARGLFEDKVSNVWCALNVVYKFKDRYCDVEMLRICTAATLAAILPSSVDLFVRPNVKKFVPALINSSLAFFLFSFQVHEKSILLVAVPVVLYLPNAPIACFWFLIVSTFSLLPLLVKDQLTIAFVSLVAFYGYTFKAVYEHTYKKNDIYKAYRIKLFKVLVAIQKGKDGYSSIFKLTYEYFVKNPESFKQAALSITLFLSLLGCLELTLLILIFEPPRRYPDLFPLLISVYSCVHFVAFFVYFNIVQLKVPQVFDHVRYVKFKSI